MSLSNSCSEHATFVTCSAHLGISGASPAWVKCKCFSLTLSTGQTLPNTLSSHICIQSSLSTTLDVFINVPCVHSFLSYFTCTVSPLNTYCLELSRFLSSETLYVFPDLSNLLYSQPYFLMISLFFLSWHTIQAWVTLSCRYGQNTPLGAWDTGCWARQTGGEVAPLRMNLKQWK